MALLFAQRDESNKYSPLKDDTLETIAATKCPSGTTWEQLALYNFGTKVPREVSRALIERIGCNDIDRDHPERAKLDPALSLAKLSFLHLPKPWEQGDRAQLQTHTVQIRRARPAPAISIDALDKWFIPELETCDVAYTLEGVEERANKIDFEVFASNYSIPQPRLIADAPRPTYTPCGVPIRQKRAFATATPRSSAHVNDWHGESEASDGALKPSNPSQKRYVNVAFSPYTVLLRYYRDDADKDARITLKAFWPRWTAPPSASPAAGGASPAASAPASQLESGCLAIKWKVEGSSKLQHGILTIVDKDFRTVFRKPLGEDDLKCNQDSTCDAGAPSEGKFWLHGLSPQSLPAALMPYRAQLQAHSAAEEDNGLALALMHTEVRLAVSKGTVDPANPAYDPATAPQSMRLELGDVIPGPVPPPDGSHLWFQYRLAAAGYHPGPVTGDQAHDDYPKALKEIQRSAPSLALDANGDCQRLAITGSNDNPTGSVLGALPAYLERPWFGDPATKLDLTPSQGSVRIGQPNNELIIWIDDRHYYTKGAGLASPHNLDDYRGGMSIGDQRVTNDDKSICRAWIPLRATPALLSKGDGLDASATIVSNTDRERASRKAIGPLRVDWTFDEIDPDDSTIDIGQYDHAKARTRKYVQWAREKSPPLRTHSRKDTKRQRLYTNCATNRGGDRPSLPNTYYSTAFGHGDPTVRASGKSTHLAPWYAEPCAQTESIVTAIHEDVTVARSGDFREELRGSAGAYFRPSRIAGDGYRVRANLAFDGQGGYEHPNSVVLKARYPVAPQAHSCRFRIWRKSSLRAYSVWAPAPTGHWPGHVGRFNQHHHAAFVHFVQETGAPVDVPLSDALDPTKQTHRDMYGQIITTHCVRPEHKTPSPPGFEPILRSDYIWPWLERDDLGWPSGAPGNTQKADLYGNWLDPVVIEETWRQFRDPLLEAILLRLEKGRGLMRGHVLVEFRSSPKYWVEEYECAGSCGQKYFFLERDIHGGSAVDKPCPSGAACGGKMRGAEPIVGHYECAVCGRRHDKSGDNGRGDKFVGERCPCIKPKLVRRASPLGSSPPFTGRYRCALCKTDIDRPSDNAKGNSFVGRDCTGSCACRTDNVLRRRADPTIPRNHVGTYKCPVCSETYEKSNDNEHGNKYANEYCNCIEPELVRKGDPSRTLLVFYTGHYECTECHQAVDMPWDNAAGDKFSGKGCRGKCSCPSTQLQPHGAVRPMGKGVLDPGYSSLPLPACGLALGATWLFSTSDADTWVHEVAHHRHFEHAATAPGAEPSLHDSEENHHKWPAGPWGDKRQWDRDCIMSYTSGEPLYFCGRCILRQRGWKVQALGAGPGTGVSGP